MKQKMLMYEGIHDGALLGKLEGTTDGGDVGTHDGTFVGTLDGAAVGDIVGVHVGTVDG